MTARRLAFLLTLNLAVAPILPVAPAHADGDLWMSEAELRATFIGKTITGRYAGGKPFTEHYRSNGRLEYREHGSTIGGRWSVKAGTFCTLYDRDTIGGCFRVRHLIGNCYEFYFVARTETEAAEQPRAPDWTARGSIEGERGACADEHTA